MGHLTANVRLRPIRLGFLVQPDDDERLLEVFRINTCLGGGKFNPVASRAALMFMQGEPEVRPPGAPNHGSSGARPLAKPLTTYQDLLLE